MFRTLRAWTFLAILGTSLLLVQATPGELTQVKQPSGYSTMENFWSMCRMALQLAQFLLKLEYGVDLPCTLYSFRPFKLACTPWNS